MLMLCGKNEIILQNNNLIIKTIRLKIIYFKKKKNFINNIKLHLKKKKNSLLINLLVSLNALYQFYVLDFTLIHTFYQN